MQIQCNQRKNFKGSVSFSSRRIIGFYSVGPEKNFLDNCSQLKYLNKIPPNRVNFDLNHNIDSWMKILSDEKLKFILSFFKDHREEFDVFDDSQISLEDVPFMCCRALLKDFCIMPYYKKYPLMFTACLFRGVIFLHYLDPEQYLDMERKSTEMTRIMIKRGVQLEQYLLSSDPTTEPEPESPVDGNAHFYCVFERRLDKHRLVFSAEMDGILTECSSLHQGIPPDTKSSARVLEQLQDCEFVKVKSVNELRKFHNSIQWWAQCHLAGVETAFIGLRDKEGMVKEIEEHHVEELPNLPDVLWKPNVCLNVCDKVLTFIKRAFSRKLQQTPFNRGEDVRKLPLTQLVFERKGGSDFLVLSEPLGTEDISILDNWFINMFEDDSASESKDNAFYKNSNTTCP